MKRVKCVIAYDGTDFEGYQIQPQKRTVQGEIEKILEKMHKGEQIRIYASGRTDARVHAMGQVVHFDTKLTLDESQWKRALNAMLPEDIVVKSTEFVDSSFHSRFSAKGKEYHYHLLITPERDPFLRNYAYHYPYPLDTEQMKKALPFFVGTHDFTSFCSAKTTVEDKVRTIDTFTLEEKSDRMVFKIRGTGFLYNMVRIIVGTMIDVGTGQLQPEDIAQIIEAKDRTKAGKTVPGHGLYLYKVYY